MKTIKRAAVLVLSCALLLTAVACHQPNETVLTIGDVQIPSGLYLAMQMDSFSTFTSTVQSSLSSGETMSTISDVLKHSAEDKTSDQWIKDKTLEAAKLYAAVMTLWNEFGLSLTEEEEANLADWVDYYWSEDYQNMGSYYEPNGVSKETFAELMRNGTRQNKVFLYYYDKPDAEGKGGLETVPDADVIQGFSDNMVLVDNISIATTKTDSSGNSTSLTDDEKTAAKDKLQAYADRINNGKASFEDIYVEYNKELKEDFTAPEVTDKMSQKYPRATVYSSADNSTANYDQFKALKEKENFAYGKAYVVEGTSAYYLAVLRDITTDEFYTGQDTYRQSVLSMLKNEEFETKLKEKGDSLTLNKNEGLIRYYSPNKITNG